MRIGIDMFALQSPDTRRRGVGRFSRELIQSLLAQGPEHTFHLLFHDGFPTDEPTLVGPNARSVFLRHDPERGILSPRDALQHIVAGNPYSLDALLVLHPFDSQPYYAAPARTENSPVLASIVHDLIPFVLPDRYLSNPDIAIRYERKRRVLKSYDVLFADSDSTRADLLKFLNMPPHRVVTTSGASDHDYFKPDCELPPSESTQRILADLGVDRPFVFTVAGDDPRKNISGLIKAFALLPEAVRTRHQLVVTCALQPGSVDRFRKLAEELGIGASLVLTNEIPDEAVLVLYQRCEAFAFSSEYEGLGLPILEAMLCGAAVVAGDNSSQPEVVGDAGLLANVSDPADLAEKLARILLDPELRRTLVEKARIHSRQFCWTRTADRLLDALSRTVTSRSARRRPQARPRIALFAPWPPKQTDLALHADQLAEALSSQYAVDLFHDQDYVPEAGLRHGGFVCQDYRLFARRERVLKYHGVLYQMGSTDRHDFLFEAAAWRPGVLLLPDACVADLLDHPTGDRSRVTHRFHRARHLLEQAQAVIVTSAWGLELIRDWAPPIASRTTVVDVQALGWEEAARQHSEVIERAFEDRRVRNRREWVRDVQAVAL